MLNIRRSCDRLIFNMGIPIPGKDGLYIMMKPVLYIPFIVYVFPCYIHGVINVCCDMLYPIMISVLTLQNFQA